MYWYESDLVGAFPWLLSLIGGFFIDVWMTPPSPLLREGVFSFLLSKGCVESLRWVIFS